MFGFLGNIRLLYFVLPVGLLAAAAVAIEPNFNFLSSSEGCSASEVRPCYDKGTKNKVKELKVEAGANAFLACSQDKDKRVEGVMNFETKLCSSEVVSYCYLGESQNFVRKFDGTCQDEALPPEPEPEPVPLPNLDILNISGKFINAITKEPLADIRIWDPAVGMSTAITVSSATGDFSFNTDTTSLTKSNSLYTSYSTGCYFQNWGFTTINRNPDDSLRFLATFFDFIPGDFVINPIMKTNIELGNVPLWPGTTLLLASDVPVQISVSYPEENKVLGNSVFQTEHKLWNAIPLEQPTVVRLTDQNGTMYYSPEITLPISNGCIAARLKFAGGVLSWQ